MVGMAGRGAREWLRRIARRLKERRKTGER